MEYLAGGSCLDLVNWDGRDATRSEANVPVEARCLR